MMEAKVALAAFVPLRIGVGQFVLAQAMQQIAAGWLVQPLLTRHLESVQKGERGLSALSSIAAHVLAHVQLYSVATCTAQIVFGLLLLLGLFGRTAAGLLLFGHLFAAVLLGPRLFDSATMLLCLGLVSLSLVPSGRVLGLDSVLASRLPSWLR